MVLFLYCKRAACSLLEIFDILYSANSPLKIHVLCTLYLHWKMTNTLDNVLLLSYSINLKEKAQVQYSTTEGRPNKRYLYQDNMDKFLTTIVQCFTMTKLTFVIFSRGIFNNVWNFVSYFFDFCGSLNSFLSMLTIL